MIISANLIIVCRLSYIMYLYLSIYTSLWLFAPVSLKKERKKKKIPAVYMIPCIHPQNPSSILAGGSLERVNDGRTEARSEKEDTNLLEEHKWNFSSVEYRFI